MFDQTLEVRLADLARGFEEATIDKNEQDDKTVNMRKTLDTAAQLRRVSTVLLWFYVVVCVCVLACMYVVIATSVRLLQLYTCNNNCEKDSPLLYTWPVKINDLQYHLESTLEHLHVG